MLAEDLTRTRNWPEQKLATAELRLLDHMLAALVGPRTAASAR